jgi:LysM repeat protein
MIPMLRPNLFLLLAVLLISTHLLNGAPRRYDYDSDTNSSLKELRDSIDDLRHALKNHELEIRTFEEKVQNQDLTIEGLRQHVSDTHQASKDQLKSNVGAIEERVFALETALKSLTADLKQIKDHANESTGVIAQLNQKIGRLEKISDQQKNNIDNLESALRSIADALQVKDGTATKAASVITTAEGKFYRVKSGDKLEKIAKENNTNVQTLKELNNLTNDKIFVGQKLLLPE